MPCSRRGSAMSEKYKQIGAPMNQLPRPVTTGNYSRIESALSAVERGGTSSIRYQDFSHNLFFLQRSKISPILPTGLAIATLIKFSATVKIDEVIRFIFNFYIASSSAKGGLRV